MSKVSLAHLWTSYATKATLIILRHVADYYLDKGTPTYNINVGRNASIEQTITSICRKKNPKIYIAIKAEDKVVEEWFITYERISPTISNLYQLEVSLRCIYAYTMLMPKLLVHSSVLDYTIREVSLLHQGDYMKFEPVNVGKICIKIEVVYAPTIIVTNPPKKAITNVDYEHFKSKPIPINPANSISKSLTLSFSPFNTKNDVSYNSDEDDSVEDFLLFLDNIKELKNSTMINTQTVQQNFKQLKNSLEK